MNMNSTGSNSLVYQNSVELGKIERIYRLAKNKYKILSDKGFSKEMGKSLTSEDVRGMTLE